MKAYTQALLALAMSIALSACGTLTTVRSVHVYPAQQGQVVAAQVEEAPQPTIVEPSETATVAVETPAPEFAYSDTEVQCMAMAIYHEARGEPLRGQAAVGWVILNRTEHKGYPLNVVSKRGKGTVCDIVHDARRTASGTVVANACQFSWYCDGRDDAPRDLAAWKRSEDLARRILNREVENPVGRAIYFDGHVHLANRGRTYGNVAIGNHRFFVSHVRRR